MHRGVSKVFLCLWLLLYSYLFVLAFVIWCSNGNDNSTNLFALWQLTHWTNICFFSVTTFKSGMCHISNGNRLTVTMLFGLQMTFTRELITRISLLREKRLFWGIEFVTTHKISISNCLLTHLFALPFHLKFESFDFCHRALVKSRVSWASVRLRRENN